MIDTIVMTIPVNSSQIMDYDLFNPSAKGLFEAPYYSLNKGYMSCIKDISKQYKKDGIYMPKLTLTKSIRKYEYSTVLKIEFSAPKLLYGNNFEELIEPDYAKLISELHYKLQQMSVYVSKQELENADIVGIHYGKNIILKGVTSNIIISTIAKMDVSKRLDLGSTDFRNNGHAIRYHSNSYELSFYDKMKDLQQSKISDKRAIEKDNYIQQGLFSYTTRPSLEVLRMEVRLNNKTFIKNMFAKIGLNSKEMKVKDFFSEDIARKILKKQWFDFVESSMSVVLLAEQSNEVIMSKLLSGGFKPSKAFKILGQLNFVKNNGIRACKDLDKTFYRTQKELKIISFHDNYLFNHFNYIKKSIFEIKPIRLNQYKEWTYE